MKRLLFLFALCAGTAFAAGDPTEQVLRNLLRAAEKLQIEDDSIDDDVRIASNETASRIFIQSINKALNLIPADETKQQLGFLVARLQSFNDIDTDETPEEDHVVLHKEIFSLVIIELRALIEDHQRTIVAQDAQVRRLLNTRVGTDDYARDRLKQLDEELAAKILAARAQHEAERGEYDAHAQKLAGLKTEVEDLTSEADRLRKAKTKAAKAFETLRAAFKNGEVTTLWTGGDLLNLPGTKSGKVNASLQRQISGLIEQDLAMLHRVVESESGQPVDIRPNLKVTFTIVGAELEDRGWLRAKRIRISAYVQVEFGWKILTDFDRSLPMEIVTDLNGKILADAHPESPHATLKDYFRQGMTEHYLRFIKKAEGLRIDQSLTELMADCEKHLATPPAATEAP